MMNDDLWLPLGLVFFGIILGFAAMTVYIQWRVSRFVSQIDTVLNSTLDEIRGAMVAVVVEKEQGVFYCYTEAERQFICQGTTGDEIKLALKSALPDKMVYVSDQTQPEVQQELKSSLTQIEAIEKTT